MNDAVVGAFVLLLGAVLIGAVLWIAAGGNSQSRVDLYQALEDESVAGLNLNAAVKFSGVDVGSVREITLDPVNPQHVRLLLAIRHGTPIRADTEAVLQTQGLTGIAYVELAGGSPSAPLLRPADDQPPPTIRTRPSLSARLENVLSSALVKLDGATTRIDAILSPANERALSSMLADLASVAHVLAARKGMLDAGIVSASQTLANSRRLTAQLGPAIERVAAAADAAGSASRQAGVAVGAAAAQVGEVSAQTGPELQRLLIELQDLSASLQRLSEQIERNPASLLRGRRPPLGPGETGRTAGAATEATPDAKPEDRPGSGEPR